MYRFLFFYANVIVNKNEVLNKVKLKAKSAGADGCINSIQFNSIYFFLM